MRGRGLRRGFSFDEVLVAVCILAPGPGSVFGALSAGSLQVQHLDALLAGRLVAQPVLDREVAFVLEGRGGDLATARLLELDLSKGQATPLIGAGSRFPAVSGVAVVALFRRATAPSPAERFPDGEALLAAVRAAVHGSPAPVAGGRRPAEADLANLTSLPDLPRPRSLGSRAVTALAWPALALPVLAAALTLGARPQIPRRMGI